MEPEQRTEREITYQVGWKRGKIRPHPNRNCLQSTDKAACAEAELFNNAGWNISWLWRPAGTIKIEVLHVLLWLFPAVVFAISLWLISQLSLQP
ncbi:MAG: hypothetical protein K0S39_4440 [Paenibacillus sp.]|nr:hypothetical protein [Paenibacillus sp.]